MFAALHTQQSIPNQKEGNFMITTNQPPALTNTERRSLKTRIFRVIAGVVITVVVVLGGLLLLIAVVTTHDSKDPGETGGDLGDKVGDFLHLPDLLGEEKGTETGEGLDPHTHGNQR